MSVELALPPCPARQRNGSPQSNPGRIGWFGRRLLAMLAGIRGGVARVRLPGGEEREFGEPGDDRLTAQVTVHDPRCFREIALGGSLGAAEAYLQGLWTSDDLTSFLRLMCRNLEQSQALDRGPARCALWAAQAVHRLAANTRRGSRRNIAAHYDLGNEFFQLFLDPTLMYSSALFEHPEQSLEAASIAKLERVCRKLDLQPGDRVLEIGTGWGGFALHAASRYGCHVTTTTISRQQQTLANRRIAEAGLGQRVTLLTDDYRDLQGVYDKVVSIEMIEAVGHAHLSEYFGVCNRRLKPGGRLLIQAIIMPDQRYESYRRSVDFIQKYVFPGGHLPSVGAIQAAVARGTQLQLIDVLQFPHSYALTLQAWRAAFLARREEVLRLGFDERFLRLWEYYLCYCEAAFRERTVSVGQFVWDRV